LPIVKKTLAVVGASILGFAGALGASAAPASATPGPVPCTNALNDHLVNPDVDATSDNWYMTCVPQYGMGKAEFSITAPADGFPAGYSLADGHQTVVSSTPTSAQVQSYFGDLYADEHSTAPVYTGAFINLVEDTSASTTTTQVYDTVDSNSPMTAAFPITSVAKVTTGFPDACSPDGETYQGEYVVNYAPVTTTFSEVISGQTYKTTVTLTSPTLYLGLNFDPTNSFGLDSSKALCASSSEGTLFAASEDDPVDAAALAAQPGYAAAVAAESPSSAALIAADVPTGGLAWFTIAFEVVTNDPDDVTTLVPTASSFIDPDGFTGGPFTVTATPVLAETGVDAAPAGILGGSLLLVGAGAFVFGRRRRTVVHRD
jgi:LPXTG-motif cell wall-anchored protein